MRSRIAMRHRDVLPAARTTTEEECFLGQSRCAKMNGARR